MRILYIVQRYGTEVVGGSEAACRQFAEHLVERGHEVEVLTSCAKRYTDWADELEPGVSDANGVTVHRLPVVRPRADATFGPYNHWTIVGPRPMPLFAADRWAALMGPELQGQRRWLRANSHRFDVAIAMTYMYATTTGALATLAGRVPLILQPTAHDEPAAWVRMYDARFRQADAMLFFTPEEQAFVRRRFSIDPPGVVAGIGIDLEDSADPGAFRREHGLGDDPFLVYVGRIDQAKGVYEAADFFRAFKDRNGGNVKLVLAGDAVGEVPTHPDIVHVGFLDEFAKRSAIAASLALLQSSYFESFSIVLCESWVQRRPALVQGGCTVLKGQAIRSGGAIPYRGFAEFEAALLRLLADPDLANAMGRSGRAYVEANYQWPTVLDRVEDTIAEATAAFGRRTGTTRS